MKKISIIMVLIILAVVGFCGCSQDESDNHVNVTINESNQSHHSTDEVTINNVSINLQEWDENEVYVELMINITSKFNFDCSTIGVEVNIVGEDDQILENTFATLDNVVSKKSGDATVTLDSVKNIEEIQSVDICGYAAWEKKTNDSIEGVFSENQVFDIEDIEIRTLKY